MSIPESTESERALICAFFRTPTLLESLSPKPEFFFNPAHKLIVETLVGLRNARKATDWVTVGAELQKARTLDSVGGMPYLMELAECFPTSSYAPQHLEIISDKFYRRQILQECQSLEDAVEGLSEELLEVTNQTVKAINAWKEQTVLGPKDPTDQKVWFELIEDLESRYDKTNKGQLEGVPTGWKWLDQMTQGLQRETFYYIAGLSTAGKTAALSQVQVASSRIPRLKDGRGHKSLIFSIEMSGKKMRERQISQDKAITAGALKAGLYAEGDFPRLSNSVGHLREHAFIYAEKLSVSQIKEAMKRALAKHPDLDWWGVDYLQYITPETNRKNSNRENEVAQISRDLVALKLEFGLPIICTAALNSDQEKRKSHRPILEDIRDSKMAAYDADCAIFLHAEPNGPGMTRDVEFLILKNRDGGLDERRFEFNKKYLLFEEKTF